jgi:hypothetical protein
MKVSLLLEDSVCVADETTFKSADANIFMAVRVLVHERRMQDEEPLKINMQSGVQRGTYALNEICDDCYFSNLVDGGIAVAILSIPVLDRSNVKGTVENLESSLDTSDSKGTLIKSISEAYQEGSLNLVAVRSKGTRTHASLSCTGNGYLKTGKHSLAKQTNAESVNERRKR